MAFQPVEVAVTVMARDAKLLAVYNHKWGAFSLPMTKRKKWQDPKIPVGVCEEEWIVAAARAAAEILGKPLSAKQLPRNIAQIQEYRQSGEDGIWKVYSLQVFALPVPDQVKLVPGLLYEWLSPSEFASHQPISSTARYLVRELEEKNLLPTWSPQTEKPKRCRRLSALPPHSKSHISSAITALACSSLIPSFRSAIGPWPSCNTGS